MKKLLLIIILILLCGCSQNKKEDYYSLTYGAINVTPGFDNYDLFEQNEDITKVEYRTNEKEENIVSYVEVYIDESKSVVPMINDYTITNGIKETCNDLNGELIEKNGCACYISKRVKNRENYIILHGDILDDDINIIDRIEIAYDVKINDQNN